MACIIHGQKTNERGTAWSFSVGHRQIRRRWEDYLGREGVCAVEWSENVPEAFDGSEIRVTIEKTDENGRKITVEGLEIC